jgi:(p)ppGpp synthase/HD superfamily hydrolase
MHSCAQTNIQLYSQLERNGYSEAEILSVRDVYDVAVKLFTCRYQRSGKPTIDHLVGTASILCTLRRPATIVAAGLLHNAYQNGDFGSVRKGMTPGKRKMLRQIVGSAVEAYVARFATIPWKRQTLFEMASDTDLLTSIDRDVILIYLSEYLEHLLDLGVLYYEDVARGPFVRTRDEFNCMVSIAERLGFSVLAKEIRQAENAIAVEVMPKDLQWQKRSRSRWYIPPKSSRLSHTVEFVDSLRRARRSLGRIFGAGGRP